MAKKKTNEVTLEQLQAVATNFNAIMFEEGEGIPDDMEYDELLEEVKDTAGELEAADVVSAVTADTLKALGIECPAEVEEEEKPAPKPKGKGKGKGSKAAPKKEPEPEPEEEEEETAEESEEPEETDEVDTEAVQAAIKKVKNCKKLDAVKKIAKENDIRIPPPFLKELPKLKKYVTEKLEDILDPEAAAAKAEKKAAKKTAKKTTENRYTRSNALIDALKKAESGTREEIVLLADTLFVENEGGTSNQNVSNYMFGYVMPSLIILNHVVKDGKTFTWQK